MSQLTKPILLDETFTYGVNTLNTGLALIASAIASENPVDSWASVRRAVRGLLAERMFPIGADITIGTDPTFTVVAHNRYRAVDAPDAPTMTLLAKDLLFSLQYDSAEAFYRCENALPAGTHNFTLSTAYSSWAAGTYQFTTTQEVPAGGQLCISGNAGTALTSLKVDTYASQVSTAKIEQCTITRGSGGTALGTWGTGLLNHSQRISYGSNNYKESALRQFLNSGEAAGSVWTPQTMFDRPPSWAASQAGFFTTVSSSFKDILASVAYGNKTSNVYEAPDSTCGGTSKFYSTIDKVALATRSEVGLGIEGTDDGTSSLPFYVGATNDDRIKLRNGAAAYWWVRSPTPSTANIVRLVSAVGADNDVAFHAYGVAPLVTIY